MDIVDTKANDGPDYDESETSSEKNDKEGMGDNILENPAGNAQMDEVDVS